MYFHFGLLAWLVFLGRRQHLHIEHPLFGRNNQLLGFRVDLAATDRHRFDKEVWHVLFDDRNLFDRAFPLEP